MRQLWQSLLNFNTNNRLEYEKEGKILGPWDS